MCDDSTWGNRARGEISRAVLCADPRAVLDAARRAYFRELDHQVSRFSNTTDWYMVAARSLPS